MANGFVDGLSVTSSNLAQALVSSCEDLLHYIESQNLVMRVDADRISEDAVSHVRGALVLAHDYLKGLASAEAVGQTVKEFSGIDTSSKSVLFAASQIVSIVTQAFAANEVPDTSKIVASDYARVMDGMRLFQILYGPTPKGTMRLQPPQAQTLPPPGKAPPFVPHH